MSSTETMSVDTFGIDWRAARTDYELVITRLLGAPAALVYKAWTEQAMMAQWWGPHGFTNPVCKLNAKPGGAINITMRSPEGSEHPIKGRFVELAPHSRVVFTMQADDTGNTWPEGGRPVDAVHIIGIHEEAPGRTKLTVTTRLSGKAERDFMARMGHSEGYGQSLDRMETLLNHH